MQKLKHIVYLQIAIEKLQTAIKEQQKHLKVLAELLKEAKENSQ